MLNVGPLELMVILIVALLVVGPSRLPEVGRSIGRGLREFRKAQDEVRATLQTALAEEPPASKVDTHIPAPGTEPDAVEPSTGRAPAAAEPGSEPAAGSEAVEMARTVGRGLAELRRARAEIQRTFKVDLSDVTAPPKVDRPGVIRSAAPGEPPASPEPETTEQTPPEEPAAAE
jgi:sec-independent protein translocase protein TatA